jgi:hypothetical protein
MQELPESVQQMVGTVYEMLTTSARLRSASCSALTHLDLVPNSLNGTKFHQITLVALAKLLI